MMVAIDLSFTQYIFYYLNYCDPTIVACNRPIPYAVYFLSTATIVAQHDWPNTTTVAIDLHSTQYNFSTATILAQPDTPRH